MSPTSGIDGVAPFRTSVLAVNVMSNAPDGARTIPGLPSLSHAAVAPASGGVNTTALYALNGTSVSLWRGDATA